MTPSDYVVAHEGSREDLEVAAGERRRTTLGCMLTFSNGKSIHDRSDWLPHRVYGSNGIIGFAGKTNASPNTIIIGRVGSYCGSLHYSDEECWVTDNAIRANVIDENDARFAFYLLHTLRLNDWRSGSGQPLLNQTVLSSIPVEIPGPAEQRVIAHVLGTLDDKIELNRRMKETLEEMARALFKSWFVDFDPRPRQGRPQAVRPPCRRARDSRGVRSARQRVDRRTRPRLPGRHGPENRRPLPRPARTLGAWRDSRGMGGAQPRRHCRLHQWLGTPALAARR